MERVIAGLQGEKVAMVTVTLEVIEKKMSAEYEIFHRGEFGDSVGCSGENPIRN